MGLRRRAACRRSISGVTTTWGRWPGITAACTTGGPAGSMVRCAVGLGAVGRGGEAEAADARAAAGAAGMAGRAAGGKVLGGEATPADWAWASVAPVTG